jgi:mRNA-degrading endonuclease RelE of RelBE toxin-antitoxin system
MASRKRYFLDYSSTFKRHLKLVPKKYHSSIRLAIEEQLEHEAEVRTRNRKPLNKAIAFEAEWELRFGPDNRFRVFYRVQEDVVVLLALGEKKGNRLLIEGEEVES